MERLNITIIAEPTATGRTAMITLLSYIRDAIEKTATSGEGGKDGHYQFNIVELPPA